MIDWRSTPVEVGSRVVWPGRQSSHLWMSEGVVTAIVEPEVKTVERRDGSTFSYITRGEITVKNVNGRTVKPHPQRITVVGSRLEPLPIIT